MQVQLRQPEIIEALKQYITGKGISLDGKTFQVDFTAGRKASGLSADIDIEDCDIPGLDLTPDEAPEAAKPSLSVVKTIEAPVAVAAEASREPLPQPEVKTGTTSLFS